MSGPLLVYFVQSSFASMAYWMQMHDIAMSISGTMISSHRICFGSGLKLFEGVAQAYFIIKHDICHIINRQNSLLQRGFFFYNEISSCIERKA